ncbi:MAG: adenosylcobinamide-GDP ribazoletransferase [Crenarchaeota archaeon]|nr:adenosylcobinamide-GDP ribazoletransferase [Thermoproteota archaeon]
MSRVVELIKSHIAFFTIIPCRPKMDIVEALSYVDLSILTVSPIILAICCGPVIMLSYLELISHPRLIYTLMYCSLLILTGMLHIDGLTDVIDALFAPREKREKILKDPHVGAVGASSLFIILTLGLIAMICSKGIIDAVKKLVLSELFSRLSCSICARMGKPLHRGLGSIVIDGVSKRRNLIIVPVIVNVVSSFLLLGYVRAVTYIAATVLLTLALVRLPIKVLGGVSGDVLGYSIEIGRHISLIISTFLL